MNDNLSKKLGKRYFVYALIPFSLFVIGIVFLMLAHNEVVHSTDSSNGDVGFGYGISGIISILLSAITSAIQLFNQLIKRRKAKKLN